MKYILIGWLVFVALVYMLMWIDYFTHTHKIKEGFQTFVDSFGEE